MPKSQWFNDDQANDPDCGHHENNVCVNCKRKFGFADRKKAESIHPDIGGTWCPQCAARYLHESKL